MNPDIQSKVETLICCFEIGQGYCITIHSSKSIDVKKKSYCILKAFIRKFVYHKPYPGKE